MPFSPTGWRATSAVGTGTRRLSLWSTPTQPLVATVQEIYEEELDAFARGRVSGGE